MLWNIDGLIVAVDFIEAEFVLADEHFDAVAVVQLHAGTVHPAFVFVNKRKGIPRIVKQLVNDCILEDQVRFKEQCVITAQKVFCKRKGIDIVRFVINGIFYKTDRGLYR